MKRKRPLPYAQFRSAILRWYRQNRRALPWRETRNPYRILVAEIMLQQTQVDRVLPKYREFLERFPTLQRLAAARRSDVIRAWSGLGYNRRALNLHEAARVLVSRHHGAVPRSVADLEALPGVGPYTARAIAAFAFGKRVAAVDTNQGRIVNRWFFGVRPQPRKIIASTAEDVVPQRLPDVWNHALMDFGALVCRSRPRCDVCPIRQGCAAYPAVLGRSRRLQKTTEPFLGSNRYLRGRIIERLRGGRSKAGVPFADLMAEFSAIPILTAARVRAAIVALEREGFLVLRSRDGVERAMLRS